MSAPEHIRDQGSWATILLIYAIGVLGATTISQAVTVAPDIATLFQGTAATDGLDHLHALGVGWIGALLAGWLVDRLGDKLVLIAGSAIVIAGDVGVMLAGTMQTFFAMRIIEGIGYVCIAVSAVTMMARITSGPRRNVALALWSSFIPMSFALPLVLTSKLAGSGEWRLAFSGHAIVLGGCLVLALIMLPAAEPSAAPKRTAGLVAVLHRPGAYLLGLAFAAGAFVQTGIVTTLPHSLVGKYGVIYPVAASIGTLGMLFNTAGCLVVGPLFNRGVRPMTITLVAALGMLIAGIAVGLKLPTFMIAAVVACVFFSAAGLVVGLWALLPQIAPGLSPGRDQRSSHANHVGRCAAGAADGLRGARLDPAGHECGRGVCGHCGGDVAGGQPVHFVGCTWQRGQPTH